ncbi:outer membrane protein assembly factor BamB family protein [Rhizobium halophilum]|uniref:outer membrane protein assembly factor BamB family protein n=1 Tax=Rhizobium halophilum TaxID=2846852 RepID=UPI001EFE84CC|nr:PQQ-binding-like beta-propeller repeat protein [Rhizobium halophilum]MCF6370670.1 PQQ-binding-like beta-propeller repeat protein [Rhizobium halophilum]
MTNSTEHHDKSHRVSRWYSMALGILLVLLGLVIGGGGIWLIVLGGSWYYAVAGTGLLVSGVLMVMGRHSSVLVYAATFIFTVFWALWEVGLQGWPLVPRLVAPTVILLLVLLAIPALRRRDPHPGTRRHGMATAMAVLAALGIGLTAAPWIRPTTVLAQAETEEGTAPAPQSPERPPADSGIIAPAPPVDSGTVAPAEPAEPLADQIPGRQPALDTESGIVINPEVPRDPAPEGQSAEEDRPALAMRETGADWPAWGGNLHGTKYSPLTQITPENVGQLERIWEFNTGDLPSPEAEGKYSPENTPLKIGEKLFACTPMGKIISIDAQSGKEEWRYDPQVPADAIPYGATCRGVSYFEVPDVDPYDLCATRIIWGTLDARLIAVDAETGQLCTGFGENGMVFLERGLGETVPGWYAMTSPPTIVRGVVVVGAQVTDGNAEDSPSGVIRGFDAVTGEFEWAWDLGRPGDTSQAGPEEVYTRGTPNMWTIAAGDEELGYVFLPMGNSAVDYYGSNRSEQENEYSTALVALDVTTGQPAWHFQTVYRDVWDYDLGSQPTLIDFPIDGGTVPAVILASKQGDIFILNRETGESLFPVEERPVPQGGVEPDYLSPTQPFSTYHTLAFPRLEEADMWGMSPIDQLWCRIQFRRSHYDGIYTPPTSDQHWIQYPGYNGGNDWGSVAVDPERGLLIANYNNMPNHNRLVPREEADKADVRPIYEPASDDEGPLGEAGPQIGAPYAIDVNAGWRVPYTGLLCKEPPYGGIRAIDLATGDTVWDHPFGSARRNGPFGIPSMLPLTIGTPNNGGPAVTAGGLIFIAATTDNLIRAIDIETGETLWSDALPGGGQANPLVVEVAGRQFVIIYPGGHHFMETPISDAIIAYGLPERR